MPDPKKRNRAAEVPPDNAAKYRWLAEKMRVLKSVPNSGKTQAGLAEKIGIDKSEIGRLFRAERNIRLDQWELAQEYVGERYPERRPTSRTPSSAGPVRGVRVMGRISMGYWSKESGPLEEFANVVSTNYPAEVQEAYKLDQPTLDGRLKANDYVISVPLDVAQQTGPRIGDGVVFRVERPDGLATFTVKRAVALGGQITYEALVAGEQPEGCTEKIVGIAIGASLAKF